ncbi:DNA mismatch repair protein MutT [Serinibacter arcticus]|uniref:DNA mismatch repair protein MutT n=1 Tax=Serinibacter arcticus TaxID=1655435 RepID=A0A2U1ZRW2_9MICO|nr:NUDIX domain-containing protein [Serinibacter arcticus]PWD49691.1 DNA mismatch repair protein MutT [Serinibacter arcticus]
MTSPDDGAATPTWPGDRPRVSGYAVVVRDGEVLLAHLSQEPGWDLPDAWTLPGGGLEFGESPVDAVVREVREETGLDVVVGELLGIDSLVHDSSHGPAHALRIVHRATVVGGTLRPETGGSTDRAAWVPVADVPELTLVELAGTALGWAGLPGPGPADVVT